MKAATHHNVFFFFFKAVKITMKYKRWLISHCGMTSQNSQNAMDHCEIGLWLKIQSFQTKHAIDVERKVNLKF